MDERLPIGRLMHTQFVDFPTPRNLNYLWTFGGILTFCLVRADRDRHRARHALSAERRRRPSTPSSASAATSTTAGCIRNLHAVGASMFFLAVYIHIFRGLYYGSYKAPREVLWIIGVLIFLVMMATAFMGYSLPWGQMSFWARDRHHQPVLLARQHLQGLGTTIVEWLWGGYSVTGVDAQPLLQPALSAAVRDRRPRRPAPVGAARRRPEQPDRPRHQDAVGRGADVLRMRRRRTPSACSPS